MPRLINTRVEFKLPGRGSISGTWEPDESEKTAAWELYVEMVTRTPLGDFSPKEGSAREALESIYSLFGTTRGVLRRHFTLLSPRIVRCRLKYMNGLHLDKHQWLVKVAGIEDILNRTLPCP